MFSVKSSGIFYYYCWFLQLPCGPLLKAAVLATYWATAVLCSIPGSAWNLSFRAAQAAFSFLDEVQLFVQGVLLKLELL